MHVWVLLQQLVMPSLPTIILLSLMPASSFGPSTSINYLKAQHEVTLKGERRGAIRVVRLRLTMVICHYQSSQSRDAAVSHVIHRSCFVDLLLCDATKRGLTGLELLKRHTHDISISHIDNGIYRIYEARIYRASNKPAPFKQIVPITPNFYKYKDSLK